MCKPSKLTLRGLFVFTGHGQTARLLHIRVLVVEVVSFGKGLHHSLYHVLQQILHRFGFSFHSIWQTQPSAWDHIGFGFRHRNSLQYPRSSERWTCKQPLSGCSCSTSSLLDLARGPRPFGVFYISLSIDLNVRIRPHKPAMQRHVIDGVNDKAQL